MSTVPAEALRHSQPDAHSSQKLLLLQCFRGFASLAVLLFHAAVIAKDKGGVNFFWKFTRAGATGVDCFFVLSGFIIFWVHGSDIGKHTRLKVYSWRRFCRVYPLYFLCTTAVMALYAVGFGHAGAKLNVGTIVRSYLLMPFAPGGRPVVAQGWTLSHEALFYVLFASFIFFGVKWAYASGILFLSGTAVSTLATLNGTPFGGPYWISDWLFSPYNLEFAAGCGVAILVKRGSLRYLRWCLPAGLALLGCVWTLFSQDYNEELVADAGLEARFVIVFGTAYTLITLGAVAWELSSAVQLPSIILGLGDATYSIYLSHFVILSALIPVIVREFGEHPQTAEGLLVLASAVTVALGYGLYYWLEQPLLRKSRGPEVRVTSGKSLS